MHDSINYSSENVSSLEIKEKILPFSDRNSNFICKKCHKIPKIRFNDSLTKFNSSCSCLISKNISLAKIINECIVRENEENTNENMESYLICNNHNEIFLYYCNMDDAQLCRTYLKENNLHQHHSLFNFDFYYFQINRKKESILTILGEKK